MLNTILSPWLSLDIVFEQQHSRRDCRAEAQSRADTRKKKIKSAKFAVGILGLLKGNKMFCKTFKLVTVVSTGSAESDRVLGRGQFICCNIIMYQMDLETRDFLFCTLGYS